MLSYLIKLSEISLFKGLSLTPLFPFLSLTFLDNSLVLFSINVENLEGGSKKSTRFQSRAFCHLIPSAFVQNKSAMSRLTFLLSTSLVNPPVPGKTPKSGNSGRLTVLDLSSIKRISSQAKAIS